MSFLGPVQANPFSNENGAVLQKDLCPHLPFSYRFRPSTLQRPNRLETVLYVQMNSMQAHFNMSAAELAPFLILSIASVRHIGYSRSSGLAPGRIYFDDVTVFR